MVAQIFICRVAG